MIMKLNKWLENWNMTSLKIKSPFLETEWNPSEPDKDAAWDLYIELLTRVATQRLLHEDGNEQDALDSIFELFELTREIIKNHGRDCIEFTKIAVIVLNQIVRPFTSKWHKLSKLNAFNDTEKCKEFRIDLENLQQQLKNYTRALADMAGVEDFSSDIFVEI